MLIATHPIIQNLVQGLRAEAMIKKIEAAEARAKVLAETGLTEVAAEVDAAVQEPTSDEAQVAPSPNRKQKRDFVRFQNANRKAGTKKQRLGGHGAALMSYFDQRNALARDEKRLAKQARQQAV